ncbi:hypothetical protein [Spiroplasma sp. SV19]|uniref:hypothetical protein n=1 Tax=Spiroplasma sp. SV19 TaxID=2570468 RepID=UPI0024B7A275|nr:hypothetical protein [Spiroplasma sp. SV19]WHQ36658.1 hypothetical protein E7Y35_01890 [Spiroplasma sp. SV19]
MPRKLIVNNLVIGNQFLIPVDIENKVIISNVHFELLCYDRTAMARKKGYLLWEHQIVLKLFDYYDVTNILKITIIAGLKFLNEKVKTETTYLACYDGISQSSALAFIYLVANKIIPTLPFEKAIVHFLTNYYSLMKLTQGIYDFLKQHYPYTILNELSQAKWQDLHG